ncbi:AfsR/SARP family transcriptional regulator [Micromonospora sp. M12]
MGGRPGACRSSPVPGAGGRGRTLRSHRRSGDQVRGAAQGADVVAGHAAGRRPSEYLQRYELSGLAEERLAALERRIDADLQRGAHAEVISRLRQLTGEHPLHEGFWSQLILALYRDGRNADALAAYHEARACSPPRPASIRAPNCSDFTSGSSTEIPLAEPLTSPPPVSARPRWRRPNYPRRRRLRRPPPPGVHSGRHTRSQPRRRRTADRGAVRNAGGR